MPMAISVARNTALYVGVLSNRPGRVHVVYAFNCFPERVQMTYLAGSTQWMPLASSLSYDHGYKQTMRYICRTCRLGCGTAVNLVLVPAFYTISFDLKNQTRREFGFDWRQGGRERGGGFLSSLVTSVGPNRP